MGHTDTCNSQDDTGWPAPCNCGFQKKQDKLDEIEDHLRVVWLYVRDIPVPDNGLKTWNAVNAIAMIAKKEILGL